MDEDLKPTIKQKLINGAQMMLISLEILSKNPVAFIFPMINVSILSIFSFCWFKKLYISYGENIFSKGLFYIFENNLLASEKRALAIIITLSVLFFIFLLGFVGKITKMFTNICLSYYIGQKLKDNPTSLFKAFLKGISRTFTIIFWAISSTLIGIIVSNLENKKSKGFISTFLSNLFGNLISIGWNIITYLLVPVLAFEKNDFFASIKKSATMMKKTFGESIVGLVGFSTLAKAVGLSCFITFGLFVGLFTFNIYFGVVTGIIVAIAISGIISATEAIFKTAIYNFISDNPVGLFSSVHFKKMFIQKKI